MDKKQLEPSLQNLADYIIGNVNEHTTKKIDSAVEELAGVTARQFRNVEKRIDKLEERMDNHFVDVKEHLVTIDNHIGLKPQFEFSEA